MTTLYERLTATEGGSKSLMGYKWFTNPDGPEAAALLRAMMRALIDTREHMSAGAYGEPSAVCDAIMLARAAGVPET